MHLLCDAWIRTKKQCAVHNGIGTSHFAYYPYRMWTIFAQLDKCRLTQQVPPKQHPVANQVAVQLLGQLRAAESRSRLHSNLEAEPGTIRAAAAGIPAEAILRIPGDGMGWQGEFEHILMGRQAPSEGLPVLLASLNKLRQPAQLHPADRCLGIEGLEVEAQVAVGVFVVIALGQLSKLPIKALVAGVVDAAWAPAVAAPVAEAFGDHLELLIAHDVHRAALAHGEMMGWVEALGADVTPGAGPADHPIRPLI